MHGKKKNLVIKEGILTNEGFWWLVGYLQGDGNVDERNGIWLVSTDLQPLRCVEMIIIHSSNSNSLKLLASNLKGRGVRCTLLKRVRRNRPNPHYELRLSRRFGLVWFAENVIRHSRLDRKKMLLSSEYLPRQTISGTRV